MELRQSIFLKGSRYVCLMPDNTLSVAIKADGAISEFSVPLRLLDDSPVRTKQPPSKFFLGFTVCAFLLVGLLVAQFYASAFEVRALLGVLGFLVLLPFGFSIYRIWRFTYDITSFYYKSSGQVAVSLFTNKPDIQTFEGFRNHLIKQIKATADSDTQHNSDSIAAQLQSFAKLKEQGIVTDEEFQNIKARLLSTVTSAPGTVGFKV